MLWWKDFNRVHLRSAENTSPAELFQKAMSLAHEISSLFQQAPYERSAASSEAFIYIAMTRLMFRRLA